MNKIESCTEQQAFMDELAGWWPLAKGSLVEVRKPCVRARCPACASGKKHRAWLFSFTPPGGKRRCRYVPAELVPLLRQALDNGRQVERRMVELGVELLTRVRQERA